MNGPLQRALDQLADSELADWENLGRETADQDERRLLDALADIASIAAAHQASDVRPRKLPPFTWGPLHVREFLACGAHGDVYRAWDPRLEREVALKLLRAPATADTPASYAIAEGRLLAKVRHPNVVTVHGADRIDGQDGVWMELVEGTTLRQLVEDAGPLPASRAIEIGIAVCEGLAAIHAAGLVHRDVKAQNVVIDRTGRTILMDLGAGFNAGDLGGGLEGTPLYLAPEVLAGEPATQASDVYAVGVLLFFALSGGYPGRGRSSVQVRLSASPRELLTSELSVPRDLASTVDQALAPDPARRVRTARELESALKGIAAGPKPSPAVSWRGWALTLALTVFAAVAAMTAWSSQYPGVPFAERDWVLIAPFENATGDSRFDGVLEVALSRELSESRHINVAPAERLRDALTLMRHPPTAPRDLQTITEAARRDGQIRVVIAARVEAGNRDTHRLALQLLDPQSGVAIGSRTKSFRDLPTAAEAVRSLTAWVRRTLGEHELRTEPTGVRATTSSFEALRLYGDALYAAEREDWNQVEAATAAALWLDPQFASAHIWRAWASINRNKRDEGVDHANRALELSGTATVRERYFIRASYFLITGDQERALGELEALVRRYPDDYWGIHKLANVYTSKGRMQDFYDLASRMASIRPNDVTTQAELLRAATLTLGARAASAILPRARALVENAGAEKRTSLDAGYVTLFPVHMAWTERRIGDMVALLDRADASAPYNEPDWQRLRRANFRMSIGQLAAAEQIIATLRDPAVRALTLSFLDLLRTGGHRVPALLAAYPGYDLASVSLLTRVGALSEAESLLRRLPRIAPAHYNWTEAEILVARTNAPDAREDLHGGLLLLTKLTGARAFLYAETLAEAYEAAGMVDKAMQVLEHVGGTRDKLYNGSHTAFLWIRTQRRLAQLYRLSGRQADAFAIEDDLRHCLALADADFAIRTQLMVVSGTPEKPDAP